MSNLDLDAIEAALAGWRGTFAARPAGGPMVANVVRLEPRLAYLPDDGDEDDAEAWTDIGDMDPHCHPPLAVLLNAPGPLLAEIRTLRADLAAAQEPRRAPRRPR